MKLLHSTLLVISVLTTLSAGELTPADRKALLENLNQSSSDFSASIRGLTSEQWNYKPAAGVWSIAECAEHIALSEDLMRDMIANKILAAAPVPEQTADRKALDAKVQKMITDRSFKAKAPEPLQPSGRFNTPEAALENFEQGRAKTIALANSRDDLREHTGPHPVFKQLDAYQWLLYLSGHTMRHTAQIQEVKATSGFPAAR
jgi:hypothetical protein